MTEAQICGVIAAFIFIGAMYGMYRFACAWDDAFRERHPDWRKHEDFIP